ncbi:MAG: peptidoglycan DD-metalloendopeptidase family protein [Candidatus Binatia bacterium]
MLILLPGAPSVATAAEADRLLGKGPTPSGDTGAGSMLLSTRVVDSLRLLAGSERVFHRVRRGETMLTLLRHFGLSKRARHFWVHSIQRNTSLKRLRAGKNVTLYFSKNNSTLSRKNRDRGLKAIEIELNADWVLAWKRNKQAVAFRKRLKPYKIETRIMSGALTASFHRDGVRLGLPPSVVSRFVELFAWDVNFSTDLRKGDSFRILYRRKYRERERRKGSSTILAAELVNRGHKHFAFYFKKAHGQGNYYDLDGKSLARVFLRFPVEFERISSNFSDRRFNPLLKVVRPHHGVDFAARPGTMVRAVGNGQVTYAGWQRGGYGRMIEIKHSSTYASRYAHLQRFARGIRRGARVKKGQIIGYVGSTGRSTGPHLHYEFYEDRRTVDPMKIELPATGKIEPKLRTGFEKARQHFLAKLAVTPHS